MSPPTAGPPRNPEVRKAQWAWAFAAGLLMLIAATIGLAWLVEVVDFSEGLRISYSQEERARPMAIAFAKTTC